MLAALLLPVVSEVQLAEREEGSPLTQESHGPWDCLLSGANSSPSSQQIRGERAGVTAPWAPGGSGGVGGVGGGRDPAGSQVSICFRVTLGSGASSTCPRRRREPGATEGGGSCPRAPHWPRTSRFQREAESPDVSVLATNSHFNKMMSRAVWLWVMVRHVPLQQRLPHKFTTELGLL